MNLDRIRGCLLGGAMGDALGRPLTEIAVQRRLHFRYGRQAPRRLAYAGRPPVPFTDATRLALFVADGLIRHRLHGIDRSDAVRRRLLAGHRPPDRPAAPRGDGWLARALPPTHRPTSRRRAERTFDALAKGLRPDPPTPPDPSGGGPAMARSAPYGLALPSVDAAFDAAFHDAGWTHGDPLTARAAGTFAALIHTLSQGGCLADALQHALTALTRVEGAEGPVAQALSRAHAIAGGGPPAPDHLHALGDGRDGVSALAIALCCVMGLEDASFYGVVRAMWRAVAHEGASATTGATAGSLLGALLGTAALPPAWLIDLDRIDVVERIARDLHAVLTGGPVEAEAYPR